MHAMKRTLFSKNTLPSKVDLITGSHTKNIIVGILIMLILMTLMLAQLPEKVIDRLLDALLALIGLFAATKFKK